MDHILPFQKNYTLGDLVFLCPRILVMIGTTTLSEKLGASKYRIGYTMPSSTRKPKNQMVHPTEKLDANADWSAKVLSVRDFKDERAFADLFAHFAPRIKGFLVKSGASAQVAEECAQEIGRAHV